MTSSQQLINVFSSPALTLGYFAKCQQTEKYDLNLSFFKSYFAIFKISFFIFRNIF